ncbi:hypothetical protein HGA11_07245 [Mycolicibacterium septicum DSM 44393]|uniref:HTH lysR-type domain-containing protein n=1 Tax=Mycolicibacterium septicum DSM 44393 TaxID=1341646 RepID=A0A7X6MMT6_9MYCO|nr:TniQ family protein [Mycolicibacterium septicum]NKZ10771.1 hypothetical protein [Mycolicibacterium septicum DSM 44393]
MTRTLPLRIGPEPGEALDSWLEALAIRFNVPLGDICRQLGIPPRKGHRPRWLLWLSDDERRQIANATGMDPEGVVRCTLSTYDHRAIEINYTKAVLNPKFPFTRHAGSRYCPLCLAESGGRWRLCWRLGWTFACLRHHCLLVDHCPRCGQPQRMTQSRWLTVPHPNRCQHSNLAVPCNADLTDAPVITLTEADQIVRTQQMVFDIIDTDRANFGVYRDYPCHARDALRDIKALAVRAFMYANRHGLPAITPPTLVGEYAQHDPSPRRRTRYMSNRANIAPARAVEAAAAISAALNILREPNVADAGEHAAWMVERRERPYYPAELNSCAQERPLVAAILIKAFAPRRGPCTQLRYQSPLRFPVAPSESPGWLQCLIECMPAVFWPSWTVRLTPPNTGRYTLPLALSCAALLVGTRCSPGDAAHLLGHAINGSTAGKHLMVLQQLTQWNDVCLALVRVARYLATHPTPIDYARRRQLDYEDLLTEDRWNEICRETGELPGNGMRRQIARLYLYEKISGLPARTDRLMAHSESTIGFWSRVFNFPAEASPQFASILLDEARQFLSSKGIDEPLVWHPPLTLLHDLTLPGIDPERFDSDELRRALNQKQPARIGPIARRLNTSSAVVRCLLDIEIDKTSTTAAKYHVSPHPVRDRLCAELTPAILEDRYIRKGQSLSAIARSYGVRGPLVRKVAEQYGIPLRGRPTRTSDWLFTEHAVKRRTCRDIAAEVGVNEVTVRNWVKRARPEWPPPPAIKHRPIGVRAARALLRPDTMTDLQRRQLRHFARTLHYPTIQAAAEGLAISEGNLRKQIHAVEHRYGAHLIQRARHSMGQRPTLDGVRLAEAVRVTIGLG